MNIDLHSHSVVSDGTLTPSELVKHALTQGVDVLGLTDHDHTGGLEEAGIAAEKYGIRLIAGVEISVTWARQTIHILGLGIDPDNQPLQSGLEEIRRERNTRAEKMGQRLEKLGVVNAESRARAMGTGLVARTHYGRLLVEDGFASDMGKAIKKYLVNGKAGFVNGEWASLQDAVGWIVGAGGVAVIAHPLRYKMTASKLRYCIRDFKACGGTGIEVITGSHSSQESSHVADLANRHDLTGSRGSDYHGPVNPWIELGRMPALPKRVSAVWDGAEF